MQYSILHTVRWSSAGWRLVNSQCMWLQAQWVPGRDSLDKSDAAHEFLPFSSMLCERGVLVTYQVLELLVLLLWEMVGVIKSICETFFYRMVESLRLGTLVLVW